MFNLGDNLFGVVSFVCDDNLERNAFDQGFCPGDMGGLTRCQDEFDR